MFRRLSGNSAYVALTPKALQILANCGRRRMLEARTGNGKVMAGKVVDMINRYLNFLASNESYLN